MWPSTEMTVALRSFDLETPALHHAWFVFSYMELSNC